MPFARVPFKDLGDPDICRVFAHANNYLADAFTMLGANPAPSSNGGKCNFSVALVLTCVLDGLATEIFPILPRGDAQKRIAKLLERLDWGPKTDGWVSRADASKILYDEIRSPLVHNLAADTKPRIRPEGYSDAAIVHRMIDGATLPPDELDGIGVWNSTWPIIWDQAAGEKPGRIMLSTLALYWHVKKLTIDLATDPTVLENAVKNRPQRKVKGELRNPL